MGLIPFTNRERVMPGIIDHFTKDKPFPATPHPIEDMMPERIEGCSAVPLVPHGDSRGRLVELLTTRDGPIHSILHVYQVFAAPRSIRGWVYHARSADRLAFTSSRFRVVLHDIREASPTYGRQVVLTVGEEAPVLLTIAPFVAHVVENLTDATGTFTNMPTRAWDPADPDKQRLPLDSPVLPYPFPR